MQKRRWIDKSEKNDDFNKEKLLIGNNLENVIVSCRWVRSRVHPGQIASPLRSNTQTDRTNNHACLQSPKGIQNDPGLNSNPVCNSATNGTTTHPTLDSNYGNGIKNTVDNLSLSDKPLTLY